MGFEFNEDGSLKVPKNLANAKEDLNRKREDSKLSPNKVTVDYSNEQFYEDNWFIKLPENISGAILIRLKNWADKQHKINGMFTRLDKIDAREYILIIKGYKGKCTWAHAFLQGLNTALIKDYKTNIVHKGTCRHNFYVRTF